jgi:hypothetical protein
MAVKTLSFASINLNNRQPFRAEDAPLIRAMERVKLHGKNALKHLTLKTDHYGRLVSFLYYTLHQLPLFLVSIFRQHFFRTLTIRSRGSVAKEKGSGLPLTFFQLSPPTLILCILIFDITSLILKTAQGGE